MQIVAATEPTPGQVNEDFVITGPARALVLDGATTHPEVDTGCIHGVPWFVRHLGIEFALQLTDSPERPLDDTFADAITATRRPARAHLRPHQPRQPLRHRRRHPRPRRPARLSAARGLPARHRHRRPRRRNIDDRTAHLPDYSVEGVRAARNSPDGFYVASTQPHAAYEAVRGSLPRPPPGGTPQRWRRPPRRTLPPRGLGTAARPPRLRGPEELIRRTRLAEQAETEAERSQRRGKKHDNATAVLVSHLSRP